MKLLLMADGAVGEEIFRWLLDSFLEDLVAVVVTAENTILHDAKKRSVPVCVYESSAQVCHWLSSNSITADYGLLAWWPKIIRMPLLLSAQNGFVNTHPSLLPYNRGKHYNFWALVDESPFGVSLHLVNDGVDTGPIIAQRSIPYSWEDTGETLYRRAMVEMVALFTEVYPQLRRGSVSAVPQDLNMGSYHHSSEIETASKINLEQNYRARDLLNILRARTFPGYPACSFYEHGQEYEVRIEIRKKSL